MGEPGNVEFRTPPEFEAQKPGAFVMLFRHQKEKLWARKKLQVLLTHRNDYDLWNLPGGGFDDAAENEIDAAIRETEEETGLKVGVMPEVPIMTYASPLDDQSRVSGEVRHDRFIAFFGVILGGELKLTGEAEAIRWFNVDELPTNTYGKHEVLINIAASPPWQSNEMKKAIEYSIKKHKFVPGSI